MATMSHLSQITAPQKQLAATSTAATVVTIQRPRLQHLSRSIALADVGRRDRQPQAKLATSRINRAAKAIGRDVATAATVATIGRWPLQCCSSCNVHHGHNID